MSTAPIDLVGEVSTCALAVIGCGNLLRGDDGVGPILVRHLWNGGVPADVRLVDGGTAGMDVSFQMRGASRVVLVDACRTGAAPGTVFQVPGPELEDLPPLSGLHSHSFRWDNALAFARWLLGDDGYPADVAVYLIEAVDFTPGAALTPEVHAAMRRVLGLIRREPAWRQGAFVDVRFTDNGYLHLDATVTAEFFPSDAAVVAVVSGEIRLIPVRGGASGGLVLKQRNLAGDRAVLVREALADDVPVGVRRARWDEELGALRIARGTVVLSAVVNRHNAESVETVIVPERGLWAVDIVVVFADGVVRRRIDTYRSERLARIHAMYIKRGAERDIRGVHRMAEGATVSRPQPVGAFPLPFGYLLVPDGHDDVRAGLLSGRLPDRWPDALRGHELALAGDSAGAAAAFVGDDVVSRFNRFVLDPDGVDPGPLRAELDGHGGLGALVDVVLFGLDRLDAAPADGDTDGEVLALVLASQAAAALDGGQPAAAVELLTRAVDAAESAFPLAGVLYGAVGEVCRQTGELTAAIAALQAGTKLLARTDLDVGCAEQYLELASVFHELAGRRPDLLNQAVTHYHSALQRIDRLQAPELFAAAHANLATAYLTMPMVEASDQLRLGVAVGSLRAALEVYTRDAYPVQWASAQLNLANALVYAPSTHQADNLVEAVELYEAVLVSRSRDDDPLGYARVLSNQGNALAHLGMFDHARGKLVEARSIFEQMQELDATHSVRGLLDEIARVNVMSATAHHG